MNWKKRRSRLLAKSWGRILLRSLSWAYGFGAMSRGLLYDLGLLRARAVAARVVCIGNLTAGGTGKTPAAVLAAMTLRSKGVSTAILSRGYGRPQKGREISVLVDESASSWKQCGDEPWMMHQLLKGQGVPILVSPDRIRAGTQAVNFYHSRVLILDDGFQHRALKRDLDIVLIDAAAPFGGRHFLPYGDLREAPYALRRAHLVVLTHSDLISPADLSALREEIRRLHAKVPVLESVHAPDFLFDAKTDARLPLEHLQGLGVVTLAAIAVPEQFEAMIERLGARVAQKWQYPDHHRYTLDELSALSRLAGEAPLVTTFKDIVRFPDGWRDLLSREVYVLAVKLEIVKGREIWDAALGRLA